MRKREEEHHGHLGASKRKKSRKALREAAARKMKSRQHVPDARGKLGILSGMSRDMGSQVPEDDKHKSRKPWNPEKAERRRRKKELKAARKAERARLKALRRTPAVVGSASATVVAQPEQAAVDDFNADVFGRPVIAGIPVLVEQVPEAGQAVSESR